MDRHRFYGHGFHDHTSRGRNVLLYAVVFVIAACAWSIPMWMASTANVYGQIGEPNYGIADVTFTQFAPLQPTISLGSSPDADASAQRIIYRISVQNSGPDSAEEVAVTFTLPPELRLGATPFGPGIAAAACSGAGGPLDVPGATLTCNVGTLASGGTGTLYVPVDVADSEAVCAAGTVDVPTAPISVVWNNEIISTGPITSGNPSGQNGLPPALAPVRVAVQCAVDVDLEMFGPTTAEPGSNVIYSLRVDNSSTLPVPAGSLIISDAIPTEMAEPITIAGNSGSCAFSASGPRGSFVSNGDLPPGESCQLDLQMQVRSDADACADGIIYNTASVRAAPPGSPTPTGMDQATWLTPLTCGTGASGLDLQASQFVVPGGSVNAGQPFTFTVHVDNLGTQAAANVVLTDTLFANAAFTVEEISDSADACTAFGAVTSDFFLRCELANLGPGARWTVRVRARSDQPVGVQSSARVASSAAADAAPANNSANASINVGEVADVALQTLPSSALGTLYAGKTVSWDVIVTNNGPSTARNVTVYDNLPAAIEPDSVNVTLGHEYCALGTPGDVNRPMTCNLGNMAPGEQFIFVVSGVVDPSYVAETPSFASGDSIVNEAWVRSETPEADNRNNRGGAPVALVAETDINLTASGSSASVRAGEPLGYSIDVANTLGPSTAENVQVVDRLPAGVTFGNARVVGGSGGSCSYVPGEHSVFCGVGNIRMGDSVTVFIDVLVKPDAVTPVLGTVDLVNRVAVTSATRENPAALGDESDEIETAVTLLAQLSVNKTASSLVPSPGQVIDYHIAVTNNGPSTAFNVEALDTLPPTVLEYLGSNTTPPCQPNGLGTSLTCQLGDLAPGETREFDISTRLDPDVADGVEIANLVQVGSDSSAALATDSVFSYVNGAADLRLTKTVLPGEAAEARTPFTYTITVHNLGPSEVTAPEVIDTMSSSSEFRILSATSARGSCVPASIGPITSAELRCTLADPVNGKLQPGERWQISVVAVTERMATVQNEARVTAAAPADPNVENNFASTTLNVVDQLTDLHVAKSVNPGGTLRAGERFTYTIFVDNLGPSAATGVWMTDTMSAAAPFTVESVRDSRNACGPGNTGTGSSYSLVCQVAELGKFDRWTVQVVARSDGKNSINNEVRVATFNSTDPDFSNNFDELSVRVNEAADLSIVKSADAEFVRAGAGLNYALQVVNNGPSVAENVTVLDTLPAGLRIASLPAGCAATPGTGGTQLITCALGNLDVSATVDLPLATEVDAGVDTGSIFNTASVAADTFDSNTGNNAASVETMVGADADVSVTKTASAGSVVAGGSLDYTVTAANVGTAVARDVTLFDTLDANLRVLSVSPVGRPEAVCNATASLPSVVTCALGDLAPGASVDVIVSTRVHAATPAGTTLANVVEVASPTELVDVPGFIDPAAKLGNNVAGPVETDVTAEAGLAIAKTASNPTPAGGTIFHYTISVSNNGPSVATELSVTDTLPDGVTYLFDTLEPGCTAGTGTDMLCQLPDLMPGQSISFDMFVQMGDLDLAEEQTLLNTAVAESAEGGPVQASAEVLTVGSTADLRIRKFGPAGGSVNAGDELVYTIVVDNFGPGTARDVTVTDRIDSNGAYAFTAPTGSPADCDPAGGDGDGAQTLTCALGDIPPNEGVSFEIALTASEGQSINNSADVRSSSVDPNPENNSATASGSVNAAADLVVTTDGQAEAVAGETVIYRVAVNNLGPSEASNVVLYDRLPAGISIRSITPPPGSQCSGGTPGDPSDPLTCGLGTLENEGSALLIVEATVDPSVPDGVLLRHDAFATSNTFDPNTSNDFSTHFTTVSAAADLSITKAAPATAVAGDLIQYRIAVANAGPSVARNVTVDDVLPDGLSVTSAGVLSGAGRCTVLPASPGRVICDLAGVDPGEAVEVLVTATVDPALTDGSELVNEVEVTSDTADPDAGNNSTTAETTVSSQAALTLLKTVSDATPAAGDDVVYTLEVRNVGASTAADVVVTETLPEGLTFLQSTVRCTEGAAGEYLCDLGDLAPGATARFDVTAGVGSAAACGAPLTNIASAEAENAAAVSTSLDIIASCAADLRILKFGSAGGDLRAGQVLTYTIVVDNLGPSYANSVTIRDEILSSGSFRVVDMNPNARGNHAGASCDRTAPVDGSGSLVITCDLGSQPLEVFDPLDGSGRWVVEMSVTAAEAQAITNIASVSGTDFDPNPANNTATVESTLLDEADLSVTKTADPAVAVAGEALLYTLDVTNNGPSSAANVVLYDDLPPGVTLLEVTNPRGGCTLSGDGRLACNLGRLAPEASVEIAIHGMVDPDLPLGSILANSALVMADTYDGNNINNSAGVLNQVSSTEQLRVSKTASAGEVAPGGRLDYYVAITNEGSSTARNVTFRDDLPDGVMLLSAGSVDGSGLCIDTVGNPELECSLGDIPAGATKRMVLRTAIDPAVPNSSTLTNSVLNDDLRFASDSDFTEAVRVNGIADVRIEKSASDLSPVAGDELVYTIRVANDGPSVATGIRVADALPDGVTYVQDTLGCGPDLASCDLGDLAPGESRSFDIFVTVDQGSACGVNLINNASVSAATPDPDESNNSAAIGVAVSCASDLRILKFGRTDGPVRAGDELVYTVMVDNLGPSYAHDVVIEDDVSASGTFDIVAIEADAIGNRPSASCEPTPPVNGIRGLQLITCRLGDPLESVGLGAGSGRWTVEVTLRATGNGTIGNVASVSSSDRELDYGNNVAYAQYQLSDVADLSITKAADPNPVVAGQTVRYDLTVSNSGPSPAENVTVYDALPAGLTLFGLTPEQGSCVTGTPGNPDDQLICGLGTVNPGESVGIAIVARVAHDLPDGSVIANNAFVTSDVFDANNANDFASTLTTVEARSQLLINKAGSVDPVGAGESLFYAISVYNDGPSLAQDVIFSDLLPENVSYVGHRVSFGEGVCVFDPVSRGVDCSVADIAAGRLQKVIIEVLVDPATPHDTNLLNTTEWPDDPRWRFSPESDFEEVTRVEARADLRIEQAPSTLRPLTGGDVIYTVDVYNEGPSLARGVRVSELLPPSLAYLIDTIGCGPGMADCALGDLAPRSERSFQVMVEVKIDAACNEAITAIASVSSATNDPNPANNEAAAGVAPECGSDLRIVSFGEPAGDVGAGEPLTYTVIVDNLGPGYAHDVYMVNELVSDQSFRVIDIDPDLRNERPLAGCELSTPTGPAVPSEDALGVGSRQTVSCRLGAPLEPFKTLQAAQTVQSASIDAATDLTLLLNPGTGRWVMEIVVLGDGPLDITSVATVSSSNDDPDNGNDLAIVEHGVQCVSNSDADMTLIKEAVLEAGAEGYGPGEEILYKLFYQNNTTDIAACVTLVETVPQYTRFNASISSAAWTCVDGAPEGTTCVYYVGTVDGGASGIVDFGVTVVDDLPARVTVTNRAELRMAHRENLPTEDTATADTLLDPDFTSGGEVPTDLPETGEPGALVNKLFLPVMER